MMSKRRILEIYLNVIEWGNGVFGAEAAARHYFGVSARAALGRAGGAARLDGAESALLRPPSAIDLARHQDAHRSSARMGAAQIP